MEKISKWLMLALIPTLCLCLTSCGGDDEPEVPATIPDNNTAEPSKKIVKPVFMKDLSQGVMDGIKFICRFNMGGDDYDNVTCRVHWKQYLDKPSSTPSIRDIEESNDSQMRNYSKNLPSRTSKVFECEHAGPKTRGYIYYYFECANSAGTTKTPVSYRYVRQNY